MSCIGPATTIQIHPQAIRFACGCAQGFVCVLPKEVKDTEAALTLLRLAIVFSLVCCYWSRVRFDLAMGSWQDEWFRGGVWICRKQTRAERLFACMNVNIESEKRKFHVEQFSYDVKQSCDFVFTTPRINLLTQINV